MSEKQVDALDHQRRAMLQVEGARRRDAQLQRAVAAERLGPGGGGEFGPDHRGPFRLETPENAAAAARDDWPGQPRGGSADRPHSRPAVALARRALYSPALLIPPPPPPPAAPPPPPATPPPP